MAQPALHHVPLAAAAPSPWVLLVVFGFVLGVWLCVENSVVRGFQGVVAVYTLNVVNIWYCWETFYFLFA